MGKSNTTIQFGITAVDDNWTDPLVGGSENHIFFCGDDLVVVPSRDGTE